MAAGLLAALTVALGVDTAQFSEGLKQAQGKLAGFASKMKGPMLAVGAAVAAAAGGLAVGLKSTIDAADDMSKAASKIGIPIEELSRLKYAADLSGVSFEGLQTGVRKVSSIMADSAAGITSATEAMSRYGLSAKNADGSLKSASQIMSEVADKFAAMPDGAEKTAMALDLFGKAGADMIPLLNGGSAALTQLMGEADKFGQVFSEGMGKNAEAFNDNISRLQGTFGALAASIATAALPYLVQFSDWLVANSGNITQAAVGFIEFTASIAQMGLAVGAAVASVIAAYQSWQVKGRELGAEINQFATNIVAWFAAIPEKMAQIGAQIIDGLWAGISNAAEGLKAKVTGIASGIKDSFTGFFQIRSPSRVMMEVGQNVMAGLNDGMASMQGDAQNIAQSIGSTIGDAFAGVINGSMSVKDALKSVLSSVASMLANSAIKTLFGGMGGFGGGFLSSLFGGLTGYANGGSFNVGGSGGIDSQVVAFKASPNENVHITKPGQSLIGNSSGNVHVTVSVDQNGNLQAFVDRRAANVSRQVTESGIKQYDRTGSQRISRDASQADKRGMR
jgi:hypothetical protein